MFNYSNPDIVGEIDIFLHEPDAIRLGSYISFWPTDFNLQTVERFVDTDVVLNKIITEKTGDDCSRDGPRYVNCVIDYVTETILEFET